MYFAEWRIHRGLTQEQLAERVGSGKSAVSKLESGKNKFNLSTLEAWADALSCDPTDFFRSPPSGSETEEESLAEMLKKASPKERRAALAAVAAMLKAS